MRKYLPVIILVTATLGGITFYIAKDVIATLAQKPEIVLAVEEQKDDWFKAFRNKNLEQVNAPLILINFWASWCGPCQEEMPALVKLRNKYPKEQLYILGINCDDTKAELRLKEMEKKYNINFPNILDQQNVHLNAIGLKALPVTLMFSRGKLLFSSYRQTNFMEENFLKIVDEELKKLK